MFTQIQKTLRASPTVIIVEVAIPEACNNDVFPNFCTQRENICIYLVGNCVRRSRHREHEGVATGNLCRGQL